MQIHVILQMHDSAHHILISMVFVPNEIAFSSPQQ